MASEGSARKAEARANDAAGKARAALIEATALRLAAEGQATVAGARSGDTELGLLRVLAAHRIRPGTEPYSALQSAVLQTEQLARVVRTTSPVSSVAFSPDGTRIVSGSADKTLRLWPVLDAWADILCAKLTRNMSHAEWRRWVGDLPYQKQCPSLPDPADAPTPAAKASAKR